MKKVITSSMGGNSHNIDYKANVKAHVAPVITESFVDDEGEIQHILASGNTLSDLNYIKHWGQPKGVIMPQGYKGKGLDPRTNFIK